MKADGVQTDTPLLRRLRKVGSEVIDGANVQVDIRLKRPVV